ncbi:MAG: rane-associated zinc metalloprotease [Candidatus Nomurabacteria bacterium]|nr:rane-associated zinc metalloprotease [Candidatus Nomurabacteria bacterium]
MTIIIFIIVLLVTVIVHEWGHFFIARKSGMTVEEFGFGIPPRLFSWKKGETLYTINLLPIGGFVKIAGENGIDGSAPVEKQFESKPWYLKSAVLVAGVVCNILLAIFLFTAAYTIGMPVATDTGTPTIVSVVQGSPSEDAGLTVGDTITSVSVAGKTLAEPVSTDDVHTAVMNSDGPVTVTYIHFGKTSTVDIVPSGKGTSRIIGLAIEPVSNQRLPLPKAFIAAAQQTYSVGTQIFATLGSLIAGIFHHNDTAKSLVGPVGLAHEVGSAASIGFTYLLAFTAMISVNLAVINIMPFPALDGGRLVVVLLEAITRRKFSQNTVGIIHAAGFILLLGLMVFLTVGDVRRLF